LHIATIAFCITTYVFRDFLAERLVLRTNTTTLTPTPPIDPALKSSAKSLSEALSGLIRVVQFRDRDRVCCHDISVSQCYALKAIVDADGCTINELAGELYLDKSTASRVSNGLVEKGLARRERDANDGRVVRLTATATGTATNAQIDGELIRQYGHLLDGFDDDVRSALIVLVSRLSKSFAAGVDASGGNCCVVNPDNS